MNIKAKDKKIGAISLGCDKNRVDLEKMLYSLKHNGFQIVEDLNQANLILVNTCGFIEMARQESINAILSACALKTSGQVQKVVVTGCLSQKNYDEIKQAIPEVDEFLRLKDNENIASIISGVLGVKEESIHEKIAPQRVLTTHPSYAFLKISDGCNNGCSYCTIPKIRGAYHSVPIEELVKEAQGLANMGVKELVIVAQDTTRYGSDLPSQPTLVQLIQALSIVQGIRWIRLHYCYPEKVTDELLNEIATNPKVCKYIDVPFQHIDESILKKMNRRSSEQQIRNLVKQIQSIQPHIVLRTTFIVGLPGETRKAFKKLCQFVRESQFEMAGFFSYSKEEGTAAYYMKKQVPAFIKKHRLKKIQRIQAKCLKTYVDKMIGQSHEILIDSFDIEQGIAYGRTQYFSPGVDFDVLIRPSKPLSTGQLIQATLIGFNDGTFLGEEA